MEVSWLLAFVIYLALDVVTQDLKSTYPKAFWLRERQIPWVRRLPDVPHVRVYPNPLDDSSKIRKYPAYTSRTDDTRQP